MGKLLILLVWSVYSGHCLEQRFKISLRTSGETYTEENAFKQNHTIPTNTSDFWKGYPGENHVTKLNAKTFIPFISQKDSFVMFYANECKSSQAARPEFAKIAQEMAYTEGFTHLNFGALDCNETLASKYICHKSLGPTSKYPRFIYFKNGTYDRMYTAHCPLHADYFYSWLVNEGNEKYCSWSGFPGGVVYNVLTSSSSSTLLHAATSTGWPFFFICSSSSSQLISLTFILVPFYLIKSFMSFS